MFCFAHLSHQIQKKIIKLLYQWDLNLVIKTDILNILNFIVDFLLSYYIIIDYVTLCRFYGGKKNNVLLWAQNMDQFVHEEEGRRQS